MDEVKEVNMLIPVHKFNFLRYNIKKKLLPSSNYIFQFKICFLNLRKKVTGKKISGKKTWK